jgi:hypothetical protein
MSFLRHGEIYPCDEGAISRPRPRSSPWMSLQLVIPGRLLSSRARFRFTSPSYTANHQPRPTMLQQRTAKCRLTDCLSRGVQSNLSLNQNSLDWTTLAWSRPSGEVASACSWA